MFECECPSALNKEERMRFCMLETLPMLTQAEAEELEALVTRMRVSCKCGSAQ